MLKLRLIVICCCICLWCGSCGANNPTDPNVVKITMWHGINPPENRDVFDELVLKFNQTHPNIEVEALYVGQPDGQLPKILAAVVNDQPPDLLWFVAQITGQLDQLGALLPLEDWLNNSPIRDEIDPAMFGAMTLGDRILSIPFATNNTAIFYRPSLFQAAGITETPETWAELETAAAKLTQDTNNDGRSDQYGMFLSLGKGEWTVFAWLPFIYSAGGELLEDGQPNLVNQGNITALQFGANLVENGWAMLSAPERGYEIDSFVSGQAAMQITGPWTLAVLEQKDIDYDVFPIPPLTEKAAVLGGEHLFVFKTNQRRQQAALTFLEYVLSEEFQTTWALKTGYLPVNLQSQQSQVYQDFVKDHPVLKTFLEQLHWAKTRPIIPKYTRLSENLGRAIEATLLGDKSPQKALAQSQKRLELIFAD